MAYCYRCDREFRSEYGLGQHLAQSFRHWECSFCDADLTSKAALTNHYKADHFWCPIDENGCGEFATRDDLIEHCEANHWFCAKCLCIFSTQNQMNYHLGTKHDDYCSDCRRFFMNANNLRNHLNSRKHKIANVPCFGSPICSNRFLTIADAILHIESGYCPSGFNAAKLRKLVIRMDSNNVITNPDRLIGYSGDSSNSTPGKRYATELARDEYGWYNCLLCPRQFRSLRALNDHYGSSVHQDRVFRCPNFRNGCGGHYSNVSGVIQHIEGGHCGAKESGDVQDRLANLMSGMNRLRLN